MSRPEVAFDAAHAEAYDRNVEPLRPLKDLAHALLRSHLADLPPAARVLVAGAGTGAEVRFLAPLAPGWRFTLVDPSAPMLDVARRHADAEGFADRCVFHVGSVASLPADDLHDAASSVLVSHFLTDTTAREAYFASLAAHLRPGGRLFTVDLCADRADPSFDASMDLWLRFAGVPEDRRGPFRAGFGVGVAVHGPAEVERLLARAGFPRPVQCLQAALVRGWIATR
jgi:tRNA (cmo5U34)-methyltransferase